MAPPELEGPRPAASLDQKMRSLLDRALDQSTPGGPARRWQGAHADHGGGATRRRAR